MRTHMPVATLFSPEREPSSALHIDPGVANACGGRPTRRTARPLPAPLWGRRGEGGESCTRVRRRPAAARLPAALGNYFCSCSQPSGNVYNVLNAVDDERCGRQKQLTDAHPASGRRRRGTEPSSAPPSAEAVGR